MVLSVRLSHYEYHTWGLISFPGTFHLPRERQTCWCDGDVGGLYKLRHPALLFFFLWLLACFLPSTYLIKKKSGPCTRFRDVTRENTSSSPYIFMWWCLGLFCSFFLSLSLQNPCQFGVVPSPHSYKWLGLLEGFPFLLGQGKWCLNSIILVMMPFFSFGLLSLLWQWRRMMDRLFRRLWICEEDFFYQCSSNQEFCRPWFA